MLDIGTVRPGTTIFIPWDTFDGGTGASITSTGLAVTDIEVYKDGSMTQRASDSGYTLLDTDGIDLDTITGIQGFSINLADNATAGFWAAGSRYYVVVSSVTVDAQTVNFVAARFDIGYSDAALNTTIATLASQTSFTLTNGPAEDDALNGCVVCIHDVASAVQLGFATVLDYTGSTKTVTLAAGTTFTAAATDNISVFPPSGIQSAAGVLWAAGAITAAVVADATIDAASIATGAITAAKFAAGAIDAAAIATDAIGAAELADGAITAATFAASAIDATAIATGAITAAKFAAGAIDAAAIAAAAIGASELAADAVTEIRSLVSGTSDSGTTTTMVDAARTEADTDYWKGALIVFTSGTLLGQARLITGFNAATDTTTFVPATTVAVGTHTYEIWPAGRVDIELAGGTATVAIAGQVDTRVVSLVANAITAGSIATDAITAAKIAADAIGASELAADAVTEIQAGLATSAALTVVDDFLDTEIAAIKAKTDSLTFTVAAQLDVNVKAIGDDAGSADKLGAFMDASVLAQVNDVGATTTTFIADGFVEATNDHFNGRLITFLSGAMDAQQTDIVDYVGATQTFIVTALTEAPADNVFFVIS